MDAISTAIEEITADLRLVPGLVRTTGAQDVINEFPWLMVYPGTSDHQVYTHDDGDGHVVLIGVYQIKARVYVEHKDTAADVARLTPFLSTIPNAWHAGWKRDKFGGTVLSLGDVRNGGAGSNVSGELGPDDFGGNLLMAAFVTTISIEEPVQE